MLSNIKLVALKRISRLWNYNLLRFSVAICASFETNSTYTRCYKRYKHIIRSKNNSIALIQLETIFLHSESVLQPQRMHQQEFSLKTPKIDDYRRIYQKNSLAVIIIIVLILFSQIFAENVPDFCRKFCFDIFQKEGRYNIQRCK